MSPWWIGVASGGALIVVGLLLGFLRLGPQEITEVNVKGLGGAKTSSLATLTFLVGAALLFMSLREVGAARDSTGQDQTRERAGSPARPPRSKSPDLLFSDSYGGSELRREWQVLSGKWQAMSGTLHGESGDGFAVLTLDHPLPADYVVSYRTRLIDGVLAELMLRLTSNRYVRAYLYEIDQDIVLGSGTFIGFTEPVTPGVASPEQVQRSLGGGASLVERSFPVQKKLWYRVTTLAQGRTYTINVGGHEIIRYRDRGRKLPERGTVGLIVNGGRVQFDDFTIRRVMVR